MIRAGVFILALLAPAGALAGDLPRFDVEAHCDRVARFGGGFSAVTMRGCLDIEQSSYDALKRDWPDLPEEMRRYCIEVARFGGGDYMTLRGCIDLERAAARENAGSSFRF